MKSDTEIADSTVLEEIDTIARKASIPVENLFHYGPYIAKVPLKLIDDHKAKKSHLILVTAITATKAGVGKTTVSIGLGMGLNHIGKKAIIALREPSLGPCFGIKGGATGGGYTSTTSRKNQSALHRRFPCHYVGSQLNRRTVGQLYFPEPSRGQWTEKYTLEAGNGHERPITKADCDRIGGTQQRDSHGSRIRHYSCIGNHGDSLSLERYGGHGTTHRPYRRCTSV